MQKAAHGSSAELFDDEILPVSTNRMHQERGSNDNEQMRKKLANESDEFEYTPKKRPIASSQLMEMNESGEARTLQPKHY